MNPVPHAHGNGSWLAVLALAVAATGLRAPTGGIGTLTGRVDDGASGKSLQGAIIRAVGTAMVDHTDPEPRFVSGTARIDPMRASYLSVIRP